MNEVFGLEKPLKGQVLSGATLLDFSDVHGTPLASTWANATSLIVRAQRTWRYHYPQDFREPCI